MEYLFIIYNSWKAFHAKVEHEIVLFMDYVSIFSSTFAHQVLREKLLRKLLQPLFRHRIGTVVAQFCNYCFHKYFKIQDQLLLYLTIDIIYDFWWAKRNSFNDTQVFDSFLPFNTSIRYKTSLLRAIFSKFLLDNQSDIEYTVDHWIHLSFSIFFHQ